MRISEELRMAAAGQERTWQAKLELRAADEIEQLEKRVKELEQAKARNENDPEMAFDDELGWLHKDSLAGVNELRKQLSDLREKLVLVDEALVDISKHRSQDPYGPGSYPSRMAERAMDALAIIQELRREPCGP